MLGPVSKRSAVATAPARKRWFVWQARTRDHLRADVNRAFRRTDTLSSFIEATFEQWAQHGAPIDVAYAVNAQQQALCASKPVLEGPLLSKVLPIGDICVDDMAWSAVGSGLYLAAENFISGHLAAQPHAAGVAPKRVDLGDGGSLDPLHFQRQFEKAKPQRAGSWGVSSVYATHPALARRARAAMALLSALGHEPREGSAHRVLLGAASEHGGCYDPEQRAAFIMGPAREVPLVDGIDVQMLEVLIEEMWHSAQDPCLLPWAMEAEAQMHVHFTLNKAVRRLGGEQVVENVFPGLLEARATAIVRMLESVKSTQPAQRFCWDGAAFLAASLNAMTAKRFDRAGVSM